MGTTAAIAATTTPVISLDTKYCGRALALTVTIAAASVCSKYLCFYTYLSHNLQSYFHILGRVYPFRVGVVFDDSEICTTANTANACEFDNLPGGIIGFAIGFEQMSC